MKKFILSILGLFLISISSSIKAQTFFDTSEAEEFFSIGVRAAINTSNKTFPSGHFNQWNKNNWGTGFNIGAIANLNIREYLTIQPGIFFEARSGNYSYFTHYINIENKIDTHYEMGNLHGYYVTIPVMGIVNFNLSENIKWMVELGPYFQYSLKQTGQNNITVLYRFPQSNMFSQYTAQYNSYDIGLKMGSGLRFYEHYYFGIHYLAGMRNAWKQPEGGKNKSWEFSLGYYF